MSSVLQIVALLSFTAAFCHKVYISLLSDCLLKPSTVPCSFALKAHHFLSVTFATNDVSGAHRLPRMMATRRLIHTYTVWPGYTMISCDGLVHFIQFMPLRRLLGKSRHSPDQRLTTL